MKLTSYNCQSFNYERSIKRPKLPLNCILFRLLSNPTTDNSDKVISIIEQHNCIQANVQGEKKS